MIDTARKGTVVMTKAFGVLAMVLLAISSVPCLAQETLPYPAEAERPAAEPGKAPPVPLVQDSAPCADCGHRHSEPCLQHLLAWATYRPLNHGGCNCLHQCVPVCTPPLYTFFPCHGFGDCGPEGCTSCGESAGPCTKDCFGLFHHQ